MIKMPALHRQTVLLGVIGDPIEHSLSPVLHNFLMDKLRLRGCYHAFRVQAHELNAAIKGAQALGFRGLNVTVPHKTSVVQYIDELDALAQSVGAVNTLVFEQGKILGSNTDIPGFLQSLEWAGEHLQGRDIMIIGAGGAARAVVRAAIEARAENILLANRTRARAASLAQEVQARVVDLNEVKGLRPGSVVVNATPVGMWPKSNDSPLPAEFFRPDLIYMDLVYNPLKTQYLQYAHSAGAKTIDGLGMLIFQGILALEKWLEIHVDTDSIYGELRNHLTPRLAT